MHLDHPRRQKQGAASATQLFGEPQVLCKRFTIGIPAAKSQEKPHTALRHLDGSQIHEGAKTLPLFLGSRVVAYDGAPRNTVGSPGILDKDDRRSVAIERGITVLDICLEKVALTRTEEHGLCRLTDQHFATEHDHALVDPGGMGAGSAAIPRCDGHLIDLDFGTGSVTSDKTDSDTSSLSARG